ncbi:hypothetical protein TorRG33x02_357960 [Trema orientale]|uniref:Uncharacterized protein n=1 Tax=Trema orientale TaxID=63057 RepID=A0A2P5A4B7_TREOI|nr:hypothetical protein TorRG33x02_357960 [Trema orientale]
MDYFSKFSLENMALHLNYTIPFGFLWKPKDRALKYGKILVSDKEVIEILEELVRRKYREAEVFLVMPKKVMELEWREDSDAIKHHPGPEPLKRCIIEELAEDTDIQGLKVVTSQSQSQHSYTDLGPEAEIGTEEENTTRTHKRRQEPHRSSPQPLTERRQQSTLQPANEAEHVPPQPPNDPGPESSPQPATKPDNIPLQPLNAPTNSDPYIPSSPHFPDTTQQSQYERVFEDVYDYDPIVEDLLAGGSRNHTQNEAPVNDALVNEAPVNEPIENEVPVNEPAENKDLVNEPTENEEDFEFVQEEYAQDDEGERNMDHQPDSSS